MRPLGPESHDERWGNARRSTCKPLIPSRRRWPTRNSYGFRKERSTADAIEQCHMVLFNRGGARWIFEGDIKSCFDRISHEWLMAHIPMCKTILQKWLKAGHGRSMSSAATKRYLTVAFVPPVLANMSMGRPGTGAAGTLSESIGPEPQSQSQPGPIRGSTFITREFQKTLGGRGRSRWWNRSLKERGLGTLRREVPHRADRRRLRLPRTEHA